MLCVWYLYESYEGTRTIHVHRPVKDVNILLVKNVVLNFIYLFIYIYIFIEYLDQLIQTIEKCSHYLQLSVSQ